MSSFKLYEINELLQQAINEMESSIDEQTGEIPEEWYSLIEEIQMERDKKALDCARAIKHFSLEADAIDSEIKKLKSRKDSISNKAESIKTWLATFLQPGEKLSDSNTVISWRKSSSVNVESVDNLADEYKKTKIQISADKVEIKNALKSGKSISGCSIVESQNIQIK